MRLLHGSLIVSALALGVVACADQRTSSRSDPPGTAAQRAYDRAAGTNTSGAYPMQSDGMPGNQPGTAVQRGYDRATDSNTSGAYPQSR